MQNLKVTELDDNHYLFGNKGTTWDNSAHIAKLGESTTLCDTPMLSSNWAKIHELEEAGCPKCIEIYNNSKEKSKPVVKPYKDVQVGDIAYNTPNGDGPTDKPIGTVLWVGDYEELENSEYKGLIPDWENLKEDSEGYDLIVINDTGHWPGPYLYNYDNDPCGCAVLVEEDPVTDKIKKIKEFLEGKQIIFSSANDQYGVGAMILLDGEDITDITMDDEGYEIVCWDEIDGVGHKDPRTMEYYEYLVIPQIPDLEKNKEVNEAFDNILNS